ncbi:hypothetical protein JHK85_030821 [Glycine max]|nr:hypothetical protein JHK85_030821 [Glycine max]
MEIQSDIRIMKEKENACGAIEEPECIGMDQHLKQLKIDLLKDGVSVLVLTGLGESGKTTLAKKICWNPQIKRCGPPVPEFQSDDDATSRLRALLRSVGEND